MFGLGRFTGAIHHALIFGRRVRALADHAASVIPAGAQTVLDVGCGDGTLARLLLLRRPELRVTGLEIQVRPETAIPVIQFDGRSMPYDSGSHDVVMMMDVLHHAQDAHALLRESARVASRAVIVKDHVLGRFLSGPRLRMMDWAGNVAHGVALPYNYWTRDQWSIAFERAKLQEVERREHLGLYPPPVSWIFEPNLHFLSRLTPLGDEVSPRQAE